MMNELNHVFFLPEGIPLDLLLLAACASVLVIVTHVPLGMQVLARGIIFIDLASPTAHREAETAKAHRG